jgi:hypothetical protein
LSFLPAHRILTFAQGLKQPLIFFMVACTQGLNSYQHFGVIAFGFSVLSLSNLADDSV